MCVYVVSTSHSTSIYCVLAVNLLIVVISWKGRVVQLFVDSCSDVMLFI